MAIVGRGESQHDRRMIAIGLLFLRISSTEGIVSYAWPQLVQGRF